MHVVMVQEQPALDPGERSHYLPWIKRDLKPWAKRGIRQVMQTWLYSILCGFALKNLVSHFPRKTRRNEFVSCVILQSDIDAAASLSTPIGPYCYGGECSTCQS